jgi:hypothetical protein
MGCGGGKHPASRFYSCQACSIQVDFGMPLGALFFPGGKFAWRIRQMSLEIPPPDGEYRPSRIQANIKRKYIPFTFRSFLCIDPANTDICKALRNLRARQQLSGTIYSFNFFDFHF